MRAEDHFILSKYIWNQFSAVDNPILEKAFLIGSVEPDKNVFTYLRGIKGHKKFFGHNAENARKHLGITLIKLLDSNRWKIWQYFVLGTALHYIADSFTFPHNAIFKGTIAEHIGYESKIHKIILADNNLLHVDVCPLIPFDETSLFISATHRSYLAEKDHNPVLDLKYIETATSVVFKSAMAYASNKIGEEKDESTYYDRLVCSSYQWSCHFSNESEVRA